MRLSWMHHARLAPFVVFRGKSGIVAPILRGLAMMYEGNAEQPTTGLIIIVLWDSKAFISTQLKGF